MEEVVRLDSVSKTYGEAAAATTALKELNLSISRGEFVSIMGPSGCGKSTLLNLVAGYDRPTSGSVTVSGQNLWRTNERGRSTLRAHKLGFVVQSFDLLPRLTVFENVLVRLGPLRIRGNEARLRTGLVLDQVDIATNAWSRYPGELSGGEQQRVAMARALVAEPSLLLADEPTGNLDSTNGAMVLDLLRSLNRERQMSVLMVTHEAFAATYGHRTIMLKDGEISQEVGSLENIVEPKRRKAVVDLSKGKTTREP